MGEAESAIKPVRQSCWLIRKKPWKINFYPGGQLNFLPPMIWICRWNTVWPASSPVLIIVLQLSKPAALAISVPLRSRWPSNSWSSFFMSYRLGIGFLGIIKMWVGAWGVISLKAKHFSSLKTSSQGISPLRILSKIVVIAFEQRPITRL